MTSCLLVRIQSIGDTPGREFVNAVDRMIGDTSEDEAQIGFGIDVVEFGRPDQAVNGCRTFTT
jgi:hypothetical protein